MANIVLDEQTHDALVDLLADESVTKTEAIRDILKGKRFHYNSVVRDEVEEHESQTFQKQQSKPVKRTSYVQNEPKPTGEVTIDCTGGNYVEPKDPIKAMIPVGHVAETPKEIIAVKHLGEINAMSKMMIPLLSKDMDIVKSQKLIEKYTSKLKFNEDGSAQNMISLIEQFKKEINYKEN